MPRLLVVFVGLIILSVSTACGEQAFPYKAYATADEVEVRSGPGEDFYPTDKLQKGETVEVYRRDAGGWCANQAAGREFFLDLGPGAKIAGWQPGRGQGGRCRLQGGQQLEQRART